MLALHEAMVAGRLEAVSAAIAPGQITAICGPNGAGKSTMLALMAGLIAPASGTVRLDGQDLAALPRRERARRIGFLPQDAEVAWNIDVRTLVSLGRLPHGTGAAEDARAVDAALVDLALVPLAARPIASLSGGERARAMLARVLAGEPDYILADEPLASLDLAHQAAMLGHLRRLADGGAAVVLVLHDLAAAMNHADRVVVLADGRIAADGQPSSVLTGQLIRQVWQIPARWVQADGKQALLLP